MLPRVPAPAILVLTGMRAHNDEDAHGRGRPNGPGSRGGDSLVPNGGLDREPGSIGDIVHDAVVRTPMASTFLLALWLEGRNGRWELTERGERDGVMRWWTKLALEPEPERLEEAKMSAEAIVGPCIWLDRGTFSAGRWTVVSTVGRPAGAAAPRGSSAGRADGAGRLSFFVPTAGGRSCLVSRPTLQR